jgi:putative ABC transport system substrate-binding protein
VIEYRWAEGNPGRLKDLAAEFVALNVDAIITHALPGTRAAAEATKSIPIVIADAIDPVAAGLVASHSKPGGNITGSTSFQPENSAKRLELLKEVRPRLKRAAVLLNARALNDVYLREMEPAAKRMDLELLQFRFNAAEELAAAFAAMAASRVEATVIGEDPLLNTHAGAVAALALAHRLPTSGFTNFADAGGLLGYGSNRVLVYARAADFVDKILKGAYPGDLPIERASRFELIVNRRTARALDVRLPPQLLQRADRVIDS